MTELFNKIRTYNKATYDLARAMAEIKDKQGRKVLVEITPFDIPRINALCGIGNINADESIIPEILIELLGQTKANQTRYQTTVKKSNLKASELRKLIRKNQRKVVDKDKKVEVSPWMKHLILLQNDVKGMDTEARARALSFVTNTLLN